MRVRGLKKAWFGVLLGYGLVAQAAPLEVQAPWVRATVAQQTVTGAFMTLRASEALQVVGVRSPIAERVEMHETTFEQQVMRMRARPVLVLKAGQTLELKPGAWHLMLLGLKAPVVPGQTVPLVLTIQTQAGQRYERSVSAPVWPLHAAPAGQGHDHGDHGHHAGHGH